MKPGTLITKLAMLAIALAVAAWLIFYTVKTLTDPFETAPVYEYTLEESAEVTGWLVRSELVLPPQSGASSDLVDLVLREGEKAAKGDIVARVYQNAGAVELQQEISRLERELSQVQYIMSRSQQAADTPALDAGIEQAITAIHAMAARGDLSTLSSQTDELKNLVYRREYTYSGEDGLEERAASLSAQLRSLRQQAGQSTTSIRASQPGVFSAQVDGYEGVLTPQALEGLTPSGLEALTAQQQRVVGSTSVGKLITSSRWYLVMLVEEAEAEHIGSRATIRFSRDYTEEIRMTVERVSDPEDGRVLVVLSTNSYLSETTLLRQQSTDLIYNSTDGLRVPQRALRIRTETRTDKDTGQESEVQVTGVYTVTGSQIEWKPVEVLGEGEGFYLVRPSNASSSRALRAGDEVVVRGENIYDGKVIR